MLRTILLSALVACASGYQMGAMRPAAVSAFTAARAPCVAMPVQSSRAIMMSDEEPSAQESAIAVALGGAFVGIYVLDNVISAAVLAALSAYLTTTDSQAGDIATSAGRFATWSRPAPQR